MMRKYDMTEGADMPANEDNNLAVQVAELRSDVRHIQSDVTDIKSDLRVTNQRIDRIDEKFESVNKEIGAVKDSLASAKIWALGLYFALAGSLLYVLARGFRWF
jgi:outer membrane murein-binding lipoprotein Lpp